MIRRWMAVAGGVLLAAACAGAPEPGAGTPSTTNAAGGAPAGTAGTQAGAGAQAGAQAGMNAQQAALRCQPVARMPVAGRASAYDSVAVSLGGAQAKLCYGRPSAKGRTIFGGLVPYDTLWRTGANEPTTIHLPVDAEIAGMRVGAGSYSIYTVPGRQNWTIIVNRSTSQWGHEGQYSAQVRSQEVGRATVAAERTTSPVETFTIRAEPRGSNAADLVMEWENTRVRVPIRRG